MKAASLNELKQALTAAPTSSLADLCLRLAKFKKENKELLTYLLFEANDVQGYMEMVKKEMDSEFQQLPKPTLYLTKKSLRKILRITGKHIRYISSKQAEAELLIYFCSKLKQSGIPVQSSPVLANLYQNQLKKINTALATLHEDLQYDYLKDMKQLTS